jgi:putative FmdB family regulatory protein
MPIYEYRCKKCGQFEVMQKITERPLVRCPTCQRKVTKLISNSSFQLKGSGWYATDYAKGGKAKDTSKESGVESKTESKSENKTESKSDSKTESQSESKTESKADKSASAGAKAPKADAAAA